MASRRRLSIASLLLLCAAPTSAAEWRATFAMALGGFLAPVEIGRARNATGGEALIARLGSGVTMDTQIGLESRYLGIELSFASRLDALDVENELGVEFPNHGERPWLYAGEVLLYSLGLASGRVRPLVSAGAGGTILSVDLDNINDQSLYHVLTASVGTGVRFSIDDDERFLGSPREKAVVSRG